MYGPTKGIIVDTLATIIAAGLILGLIALLISLASANRQKSKALQEAAAAYEGSLESLAQDSSNIPLRQNTLALGRSLANLHRDGKGITVFDELALMNDLWAASGSAPGMGRENPAIALDRALEKQLNSLLRLRQAGVIGEEVYREERQRILRDSGK